MQDFIAEFNVSGRTSKLAYCKELGISYHTFNYHLKRSLTKPVSSSAKGFTRLKISKANTGYTPSKSVTTARLFSDGQLLLEVQGEFSAHFLRELAGC